MPANPLVIENVIENFNHWRTKNENHSAFACCRIGPVRSVAPDTDPCWNGQEWVCMTAVPGVPTAGPVLQDFDPFSLNPLTFGACSYYIWECYLDEEGYTWCEKVLVELEDCYPDGITNGAIGHHESVTTDAGRGHAPASAPVGEQLKSGIRALRQPTAGPVVFVPKVFP